MIARRMLISVWVTERDELLSRSVERQLKNLVLLFVADVEKACRVPNWPLRKTEATTDLSELGIAIK